MQKVTGQKAEAGGGGLFAVPHGGQLPDMPMLRSDQANRILVYAGAFNPPHAAHVDVLADGLRGAGADLNIAAALVAPLSAAGLRRKHERGGRPAGRHPVRLARRQRAALLRAHLRGSAGASCRDVGLRTMVWDDDGAEAAPGFLREVVGVCAERGFEVEFVALKGGDYVAPGREITHPALGFVDKIVFSEASRASDAIGADGRPGRLVGGWSAWQERKTVREDGRVTALFVSRHPTIEEAEVRLLPRDNPDPEVAMSSSHLREIVEELFDDPEALQAKLQGMVLCPELFVKFLRDNEGMD